MSLNPKNEYIGLTTMTLKERMGAHRYKGAIFDHFRVKHGVSPTLEQLLGSTEIIYYENDAFQLRVFEALHIKKFQPSLNENKNDFSCLKLNIF